MMQMRTDGLLLWVAFNRPGLAINKVVWACGLGLECILALMVFSRRMARRFPAFAALMVLYPLRAVLLFACEGRIDPGAYESLSGVLALAEFALQLLVAAEIGLHWVRAGVGKTRRYGALIAIAGGAVALAWVISTFVSGKVVVDRTEVFVWFLMIGLFAAVLRRPQEANLIRIATGFAVFSVLQLVALCGRLHARAGRNMGEYLAWSYLPVIAYIAVVVFWLVALRCEEDKIAAIKVATPR